MPSAFLGIELSLTGKRWNQRCPPSRLHHDLGPLEEGVRRLGIAPLQAKLLVARGATPETAYRILSPRLKHELPEPFSLIDMEKAVTAILNAVRSKQTITILADYDVDGGTSGALLLGWFQALGANANVFVPDRVVDGYGPSPKIVNKIKHSGTDLLITVDCGAAAYAALEEAARIGLEVVVFDHHLMHDKPPPALAVVNPNRSDDGSGLGHLTAAGVVFVALVALNRAARAQGLMDGLPPFDLLARLDLAALGTICDVAPLIGLNRALVAQGLKVQAQLSNVGLAALAQAAKLKDPGSVYASAWVFGPRLNAGGRVGDSSLAVRLLSTTNKNEAQQLAEELEVLNAERRAIEANVLDEAIARVERGEAGALDGPLLMLGAPGWHPGVIGIVAGRLKDKFHRPVIVIGSADLDDPLAKGSGRSIPGVNLGAAIAGAAQAGTIIAGGGHAMAAGLTMAFSDIEAVHSDLSKRLSAEATAVGDRRDLDIDALLSLDAATLELLEALVDVGPYGAGWPEPVFAVANVRPFAAAQVGTNHVRLMMEDQSGAKIKAIAFRALHTPLGDALMGRAPLHVVVRFKKDDWHGANRVDCEIMDASPAS
ncbi:single-stranded-DNA-specific exonuclease RecJ [Candidatus Phycosocius spiralis]|uniref:Single-stranded-DNA-specific exonuclease RecJ n=1 Tax=Candidatus Phycosocius spiralis TaxID=2815099 RepID=A0ABQ4PS79_9PROT|nr:single-stranded-DNA-specific exonuclease RecJ [Candidatus Phycosocius spiralis]GIU65876.1 single-stranded-DNA-specific exonuclease RecJ [Candidatus Phycosocius spiralis]